MGINSNVKKSDVLSTKEINELAVKFQNSVDKDANSASSDHRFR